MRIKRGAREKGRTKSLRGQEKEEDEMGREKGSEREAKSGSLFRFRHRIFCLPASNT